MPIMVRSALLSWSVIRRVNQAKSNPALFLDTTMELNERAVVSLRTANPFSKISNTLSCSSNTIDSKLQTSFVQSRKNRFLPAHCKSEISLEYTVCISEQLHRNILAHLLGLGQKHMDWSQFVGLVSFSFWMPMSLVRKTELKELQSLTIFPDQHVKLSSSP